MGDRRISDSTYHAWPPQAGMDQARSGNVSDPLSANQSGDLLARTLAKRRSVVQQFAREFFGGIVASLQGWHRQSGLAGEFDPARGQKVGRFTKPGELDWDPKTFKGSGHGARIRPRFRQKQGLAAS